MGDAAAVWREGVLTALVAYSPDQARDPAGSSTGGQFSSDGSDQEASKADEEAKKLYAALLGMPPTERDKFLAGLSNDQLTRLGKFASLGKASDGPIADIRNKTGKALQSRGINPGAAGLKEKAGKKKAAKKSGAKKSGGGSKGGGKSGGGGSKGGSSKKSGGSKSSGSKSSGSKSSGSKSSGSKSSGSKSSSGTSKTTTPKAPPKPPPAPPEVSPIGRRRPGLPSPSPGLPRPVRSSAAPESLADWNAARYAARQARP